MPDAASVGAAAAAASGTVTGVAVIIRPAVKAIFGPAAVALGEALGRATEVRTANFGRIVDKAERKLGPDLQHEGQVPLRVAGMVADHGSWCDDDLMQEYLGGVLACARTPRGRDDRAAKWANLVTQMSAYEVRTHYLIYRSLRHHRLGSGLALDQGQVLQSTFIDFPVREYVEAMELDLASEPFTEIAGHAVAGLARLGLILEQWAAVDEAEFDACGPHPADS